MFIFSFEKTDFINNSLVILYKSCLMQRRGGAMKNYKLIVNNIGSFHDMFLYLSPNER